MPLQILDLYAPLSTRQVDNALYISGFASVQKVDREGDIVDPLEFDLATFMNCPQLLVNHQYVVGEDGADRAVGSVEKAVPAYIAGESPSDPSEWVVKSLLDSDFVSFWPKRKAPKITVGDKGLFVIARVTHAPTIRQILDKEIGGFSWVGYTLQETDVRGVTSLKAIDLLEISVVNGPAMSQSTLSVTDETHPLLSKEIDFTTYDVYKMAFAKSSFNLDEVRRYTKRLRLGSTLSENEESFFVDIGDGSQVDAEKSVAIKMANQCLIAAPKIEKKISCVTHVGKVNSTVIEECVMDSSNSPETEVVQVTKEVQRLYVLDIDSFLSKNPGSSVIKQKSTTIGEVPVEIYSLEVDLANAATLETVTEATETIEAVEAVAEQATETTVETENVETTETETIVAETEAVVTNVSESALSRVQETLELLASLQEQTIARQAELEAKFQSFNTIEAVKEELKAEISKAISAFEAGQKKNEEQRKSISKSLEAFNSTVPDKNLRAEKVESQKSVSSDSFNVLEFFGQVKERK
jgi:hypothetical protein